MTRADQCRRQSESPKGQRARGAPRGGWAEAAAGPRCSLRSGRLKKCSYSKADLQARKVKLLCTTVDLLVTVGHAAGGEIISCSRQEARLCSVTVTALRKSGSMWCFAAALRSVILS